MTGLTLRRATRQDHEELAALVAGLSAESAYQRFQTGLGARPAPALVDALLPEGVRGQALLGYLDDRLVAHGVWVRIGHSRVAEIALLVADEHQRAGIGTALAAALLADLRVRGLERVEVFSGAGNVAVARMVARRAPDAERDRDGATVSYGFAVPSGSLGCHGARGGPGLRPGGARGARRPVRRGRRGRTRVGGLGA